MGKKIRLTNDFEQPGKHYCSLSKVEQDHLMNDTVDDMGKTHKSIQGSMIENLSKADPLSLHSLLDTNIVWEL